VPAQNVVKKYLSQAHYHIYNRGAFKNDVFPTEKDIWVFRKITRKKLKQFQGNISIEAFAILQNHFHFLFYQEREHLMEHFMRSIMTSYSLYYCRKHAHSGHIFEGPYKAIILLNKGDIWRTRKYILSNALEAGYLNWTHVGQKI